MSYRGKAPLTILMTLILIGALPYSASAHGGYPRDWLGSSINWRFTAGFPSGSGQRDSVREGADQWSNTSGAIFDWNETGQVANWTISFNCGVSWNGGNGNNTLNWKSIDGGGNNSTLADTLLCPTSGTSSLTKFWIRFDQANSADFHWPGHNPDDPPDNTFDAWAIASHEFGHATGFQGHIGSGSTYCDVGDLDLHTMCSFTASGLARQRTLEVHDVDTFQATY